jgi:transcriptional regulator NrdR family protein
MICVLLGCDGKSKVLDTRVHENTVWIRRRRQCSCGHIWWTVEIPEDELTVRDE